jgi:molybdenum-dependent DNA-binding transcriptional regulator ModE
VLEDMLGACLVERRRRRSRGGQGKGIERGRNMIPWLVMIDNVFYKRVGHTSESATPPTLRTSLILTYNGSTQSLPNYIK